MVVSFNKVLVFFEPEIKLRYSQIRYWLAYMKKDLIYSLTKMAKDGV